jgi:hypothetical protein
MGSRMMHYCITTEINKHFYQSKEIRIHLGGLAPDLTHSIYAPKALTHFVQVSEDGRKRTDYDLFIQKYKEHFDDSFYIGYLSHLVADSLWYDMIYLKQIKYLPESEKQSAIEKGYRDFRRLNKMLLTDYPLIPIGDIPPVENINIEGLYTEYLPVIVKQLNDDFQVEQPTEPLEIYNLESMLSYLRLSISETIKLLNPILR